MKNIQSNIRPLMSFAAAAAVALAALGLTGVAHAGDVYWSVGMSSPGVQLGVASAPPMLMQQPVYMTRQPVYMAPQPVVYMQPAPVYVQQPPVYMVQPAYLQTGWHHRGHGYGHGYDRGREWEHGRDDHGHRGHDRD